MSIYISTLCIKTSMIFTKQNNKLHFIDEMHAKCLGNINIYRKYISSKYNKRIKNTDIYISGEGNKYKLSE